MAWENVGYGYLGRNQYKKEEKHPDYAGKLTIKVNGVDVNYSISGKVKEKEGSKFFALSVSMQTENAPAPSPASAPEDEDSSIPF